MVVRHGQEHTARSGVADVRAVPTAQLLRIGECRPDLTDREQEVAVVDQPHQRRVARAIALRAHFACDRPRRAHHGSSRWALALSKLSCIRLPVRSVSPRWVLPLCSALLESVHRIVPIRHGGVNRRYRDEILELGWRQSWRSLSGTSVLTDTGSPTTGASAILTSQWRKPPPAPPRWSRACTPT